MILVPVARGGPLSGAEKLEKANVPSDFPDSSSVYYEDMTILPSQELAPATQGVNMRYAMNASGFGARFRQILYLAAVTCLAIPAFAQSMPLSDVKNVYLLPMPAGLEQYIALQLTQRNVLQVVTDPKKADVVLTDRIGADFEQRLDELFATHDGKVDSGKAGDSTFNNQHMRPLSRSHGAVFLVDRHTGDVIWSTSEMPKSSDAADLKRSADHIAARLADARHKKK